MKESEEGSYAGGAGEAGEEFLISHSALSNASRLNGGNPRTALAPQHLALSTYFYA